MAWMAAAGPTTTNAARHKRKNKKRIIPLHVRRILPLLQHGVRMDKLGHHLEDQDECREGTTTLFRGADSEWNS